MIGARTRHRLALVTSAALLLMSVAAPARAATPNLVVGSGADVGAGSGANPSVISTGDYVQFTTSARNDGPSNVAQLYLSVVSTGSAVSATASSGGCQLSPFSCNLGSLAAGATVSVTVIVDTPDTTSASCEVGAPGASSTLAGPAFCIDFVWTTTGVSDSDGGTSHGDAFHWLDGAGSVSDPNFASRYVFNASQVIVETDPAIGSGNRQATKVSAPATGISVTLADGPDVVGDCTDATGVVCGNAFGEWSQVDVADGATFGTAFTITLLLDSSAIPSGVNANNIKVFHSWNDGADQEIIAARCVPKKGTSVPANVPCLAVKKLKGNDLQITIWTFHNGYVKGYR